MDDEGEAEIIDINSDDEYEAVAERDLPADYVPTEVNEGKAKVMCVKFNNRRFCVVIRDSDGETVLERGYKERYDETILPKGNRGVCDECFLKYVKDKKKKVR